MDTTPAALDLTSTDIRAALTTLAELWNGVDRDDLSTAQTEIAQRLADAVANCGELPTLNGGQVEIAAPPEITPLMWVTDGEFNTGTVADLAAYLQHAAHGYADRPATIYAPGYTAPVEVDWVIETTPFNSGDWADGQVTVTLAPGVEVTGTWRVDGRA